MNQSNLKVKELRRLLKQIDQLPISKKERDELQIYIGDDDELNGIHTAWYAEIVDHQKDPSFTELIKERSGNVEPKEIYILIS